MIFNTFICTALPNFKSRKYNGKIKQITDLMSKTDLIALKLKKISENNFKLQYVM